MYAVGWARRASDGLVGIARHDGEVGAAHVLKYLENVADGHAVSPEQIRRQLERKNLKVIDKADLECLGRVEEKIAKERGIAWFKFDKDEDMLNAIESEKAKAVTV
jgi:ferredoxin--NADP+ reductase